MQLPSLHLGVEARIPTLFSEGPGGQAKPDEWPTCTSAFSRVRSVEHDIVLLVMLMKCIGMRTLIHIPLGM